MEEPIIIACPPPPEEFLSLSHDLCMHYGYVTLLRNDEVQQEITSTFESLLVAELDAKLSEPNMFDGPDVIWHIEINTPLSSAKYRRIEPYKWKLVERGMGFA